MNVLGRDDSAGPTAHLGHYRAADGSDGARVGLDLDRPHAALVVGKRGYGKSHTLGVLAEDAARAAGVAPVVVDPMGGFDGLAVGDGVPASVVDDPRVPAATLPPSTWPALFDLPATDPVGALLWEAATEAATLSAMTAHVEAAAADGGVRRAARNHLALADSWGVFDADGLGADALLSGATTVLDCSGLDDRAAAALVRAVALGLYGTCVDRRPARLPWLLIDEAHVFFDGVAAPALETVLTRGRTPGVSLVAATQRPSALPPVAVSQADLLIAHRLTAERDVEALAAATPTYLSGTLRERLPTAPGGAVVVDDATESVHGVQVRRRETPHGGADPRASERADQSSDAPQSGHSPSTTGTGAAQSGQ
ncbi:ATP-binding protein [Haloplanus halophilus]|uniref:ATP-binding protein n=1 Tax=Haloplanus halophilus TaxID=2949993 RepID=UPI00203F37BC|nr:ATPase [Haloplanus sp. GDY1]